LTDKILAFGWDVGGWTGKKPAIAVLEYKDGDITPVSNHISFSMTEFEQVPISFKKFIQLLHPLNV